MMCLEDLEVDLACVSSELDRVGTQIQELVEQQELLLERKASIQNKISKLQRKQSKEQSGSADSARAAEKWEREDFSWSTKLKCTLREVFKMDNFRSLQLQAMNASIAGHDVFLIMPTGGGKSLCYQLPALCSKGFTLVISPLISLMEDQIMALEQLKIPAAMLSASSTKEHVKTVQAAMISNDHELKLLYVTPEKIAKSKIFMSKLEKAYKGEHLTRIAIDEVHCCSQWGNDFRPDYKVLGILKRQFPKVPLLCLTATATSVVLDDVKSILAVPGALSFTASFNRPNLHYQVHRKPIKFEDCMENMVRLINKKYKGQSGIVYCFSRKDSEEVATALTSLGVGAGSYHSDIPADRRSRLHRHWTSNRLQVVVATVAFGMGIDKPDVRFVIHHSLSKSMENYYQESGRAGRDGAPADCVLYYSFQDVFRQSQMVSMERTGQEKLYGMVAYCQTYNRCRRSLIAEHFDEVWDAAQCDRMCDHCKGGVVAEEASVVRHARGLIAILRHAQQKQEKLTPLRLLEAWQGRGAVKLRVSSVPTPSFSQQGCEIIVLQLLMLGYIREEYSYTPYATISYLVVGQKARLLDDPDHALSLWLPSSPKTPAKADSGHTASATASRTKNASGAASGVKNASKRTSSEGSCGKPKRSKASDVILLE